MTRIPSRRLVIDASVALGAGGLERVKEASKECQDFLRVALEVCHRLVWTDEIAEEWNRHAASFARKWRVQMHARRKVEKVRPTVVPGLEKRICATAASESQAEEIRKDLPLVHAAISTDALLVSLDDTMRQLLKKASGQVVELKALTWVNPNKREENPIRWLEAGALYDSKRTLGA